MPRSMGSEESESSESSRSSESSSQSESSSVRINCSSCRDTGYRWNNVGDLSYCPCPRGLAKEMEKIEVLPNIDLAKYLPTNRVACKFCGSVYDYLPEYPVDIDHTKYVIDLKDNPPLVTCRNCLANKPLPAPPKDIISMYHNRRKLRIRRK